MISDSSPSHIETKGDNSAVSINVETGEIVITAFTNDGTNCLGVPTELKLSTGKDESGFLATYEWPRPAYPFNPSSLGEMSYLFENEHTGPQQFNVIGYCQTVSRDDYLLLRGLDDYRASHPEFADLIDEAKQLVISIANCELPAGLKKIRVATVGKEVNGGHIETDRPLRPHVFPISEQGNGLQPKADGGFEIIR
jgi:hypothetical protein